MPSSQNIFYQFISDILNLNYSFSVISEILLNKMIWTRTAPNLPDKAAYL